MDYRKLDIEEPPPADLVGRYHVVVSRNCVHATRNLGSSQLHIRQLLRPRDGCLALIELTQKLAWYDLVWGLLDGWWLFDDGRTYALQSPWAREQCMCGAGFSHVDRSEGASRESRGVHVICGLVAELDQPCPVRATSMLLTTPVPASPLELGCNIFQVPDGSGSGTVFNPLAPLLSTVDNISIFALNSPFVRNDAAANLELALNYSPTFEQQAAIYVAGLKHRQPEGPYLLRGYSVGGIMAYEMSRQLLEQGDAVEKIFLIDTVCPTYGNSLPRVLVDYLEHHSSVPKKGNKTAAHCSKAITSRWRGDNWLSINLPDCQVQVYRATCCSRHGMVSRNRLSPPSLSTLSVKNLLSSGSWTVELKMGHLGGGSSWESL